MIHRVCNKITDEDYSPAISDQKAESFDYSNVIVKKPWGYEYLVFKNDCFAIWILHILLK